MGPSCGEGWLESVSAAADGELSPLEADELERHLAGCPTCTALLHSYESQRRRLRFDRTVAPPGLSSSVTEARDQQVLSDRRRRRAVSRAAVLVGAAAFIAAAVVVATGPLGAERGPSPELARAAPAQITLTGGAPRAATVEVAAGTEVRWRNDGASTHELVRVLGGATVTDTLPPGRSASATFDRVGVYRYYCTVHPLVAGTVRVER